MNKHILKKIAAVILLSIGFQAILPTAVYASGWPTVDALNGSVNTSTATSSGITTSQQVLKTLKDYGLDTIAYTLAQKLGAKMANKLVNKANGGASGDSSQPSFIQNFTSYFSDLDMQQVDKFVTDLGISVNPFASNIAKNLVKGAQGLSQGKSALESFNLDKVVGANWKDFSTDATAGGWDGLLALSNTVNTNVGSEIIALKDIQLAKEYAKEVEKVKLLASGTKPQGKCSTKWEDYKDQINSLKEGRENYQFASAALNQVDTNGNPLATNLDGSNLTQAQVRQLQKDNISAATGLAENYGGCLQEIINNPISLVTNGVQEATNYAMKQTQQVQGWGQIIAGIFVSMFGAFVQSGLSSLSGDFNSSKNKNVGGPEQLLTKNGQQISYTRAPTIIVNLPESFPEAISLTEAEIGYHKEYLAILGGDNDDRSIIGRLKELDACIPGPDYDYSERLDNYVTMKTSRLTRKQVAGKNEKKQESRADAAADVEYSIAEAKSKLELALVDPRLNIPGAAIMKQEVNRLSSYRQKYQEKKTALFEKQSALNILYKTENRLLVSVAALDAYIPGLPPNLPFSNQSYLKLSPAEQTALVKWAKQIKKIPTTIAEWNDLTAVDDDGNFIDRDGAFAWAKSITDITDTEVAALITGTAQQREQKMRDYVLSTPKTLDEKKTFVLGTIWDVWSFPERYMTDDKATEWGAVNPTTGTSPYTDFLAEKNTIRSEYSSMAEKISIRRTVDNSKLDVNDIDESRTRVNNMLTDCKLLRNSIEDFRPQPGAQNHTALKNALVARKNSFKIKEIQTALSGVSILSSTNSASAPGVTCDVDGTNCVDTSSNSGNNADNVYTSMDDIPLACYNDSNDAEITKDEVVDGIRTIECEGNYNDDGDAQSTIKVEVKNVPAVNPTHFEMNVVSAFNAFRVCLGRPIGASQGVCLYPGGQRTVISGNYPLTILPPLDLSGIENGNSLQQQPPRDVWETLQQDDRGQLFCYFDQVLANYVNYKGAGINANRAKQQILCSQAYKWSRAELGDYIGYVFGDGI